MSVLGKQDLRYYMPLNKGTPQDGPTTSVFSIPRVQYSPETTAVVKNLMRESRLTFAQKHVFDTILRDGKSIPVNSSKSPNSRLYQSYMQNRHKHKARALGIPLLDEEEPNAHWNYMPTPMVMGLPQRRSFESIKASGDLEPQAPKCFPLVNKDAEKERLADKMAFGKDMTNSPFAFAKGQVKAVKSVAKPITARDFKEKRIEELIDEIQDRMQFLLAMDKAKKGRDYKTCIQSQINEKLQELKVISPEKERVVRGTIQMGLQDNKIRPVEHRSSKCF